MHRRNRLTESSDIQRVRRSGKSYAHPLAVLIARPSDGTAPRFGVLAGRSVGAAVRRNRARRRLREALQRCLGEARGAWDVLVLARAPVLEADFGEVEQAVRELLRRAHVLGDPT